MSANNTGFTNTIYLFFLLFSPFLVYKREAAAQEAEGLSRSKPSLQQGLLADALDVHLNPMQWMMWISYLSQAPQLIGFQQREGHTDVRSHLYSFDSRLD